MKEEEFDVVIIGGGVYGCSIAYHLLNNNQKILLIEKGKIGACGATAYSRGIVRVFDREKKISSITLQSVSKLINWENNRYPGISPFTSCGFLYLMDKKNHDEALCFTKEFHSKDYPIELLDSQQLESNFPWIKNTVGKIGVFEKKGGYGDPSLTAVNFAQGFKMKGGHIYENCLVQKIRKGIKENWEVDLQLGKVRAKVVVVTAGAYSKDLIPELKINTRSITLTQLKSENRVIETSIIDECSETFIRPGDANSIYSGSQVYEFVEHPNQLSAYKMEESIDSFERVKNTINQSEDYQLINGFKGYDAYTEERSPYIQFLNKSKGIYVATGFSGLGYKCCIKIGESIAEEINHYLNGKSIPNNIEWKTPNGIDA